MSSNNVRLNICLASLASKAKGLCDGRTGGYCMPVQIGCIQPQDQVSWDGCELSTGFLEVEGMDKPCVQWKSKGKKAVVRANDEGAKPFIKVLKVQAESLVAHVKGMVVRYESRTRYQHREMLVFRKLLTRQVNGKTQNCSMESVGKFKHATTLRGTSLIDHIAEDYFGSDYQNWFHVENQLPKVNIAKEEEPEKWRRPKMPDDAIQALISEDCLPVGGKLLWRRGEMLDLLTYLFPAMVDLRAYGKSLTSAVKETPVKYRVKLCTIKSEDASGPFPAGRDGGGSAHPSIVGANAQIRGIRVPDEFGMDHERKPEQEGWFVKGMLFGDTRCVDAEGNPEIWLDWSQVKGNMSAFAKLQAKEDNEMYIDDMYIAILKEWTDGEDVRMGYQQTQLFKENDVTRGIVDGWLEKNMEKMFGRGPDALLQELADEDENIGRIVDICRKMGVSAMSVPMISDLVKSRLAKKLYFAATGAGVKGDQYVVAMDAGVKPGTVVCDGDVGEVVLVYRFPTLLLQSVSKYTIVEPLRHHLDRKGRLFKGNMYMNPNDLTARHQGDDDGDFMGVLRGDAVTMFDHQISLGDKVFLVEAAAISKDTKASKSQEGETWGCLAPESRVGQMSLNQAKLMACGNIHAYTIMAFAVQEEVDVPKKLMKRTDLFQAMKPTSWSIEGNEYKYIGERQPVENEAYWDQYRPESWREDKEFGYYGMISEFMKAHACIRVDGKKVPVKNPIPWRSEDKAVNISDWQQLRGGDGFQGNLVWYVHDRAREIWFRKYDALFAPTSEDMSSLKGKLATLGIPVEPRLHWEDYRNKFRGKSGLKSFVTTEQGLKGIEPGSRKRAMADAMRILAEKVNGLTLEEVESIWFHELYFSTELDKEGHSKGNVNHAFRVASLHEELTKELQVQDGICRFMSKENLAKIQVWCAADEHPAIKLAEAIAEGSLHYKATGIHGWECKTCMKAMEKAVVDSVRDIETPRSAEETKAWLGDVISHLKHFMFD